jgi:hypothetical protein
MPQINEHGIGGLSGTQRVAWLTTILLCALACGCRDSDTIWSAEARSPDGRWIAAARTQQYGGPGTAGIQSFVSLRQLGGRQDSVVVLQLTQAVTTIDLKLNWLDPSHLEITYRQPASVDFQAIRCGGVDISVRNLSGG